MVIYKKKFDVMLHLEPNCLQNKIS